MDAQNDLENSYRTNKPIKQSVLIQILERREKYGLEMDDVVGSITDLILGGVDTVKKNLISFKIHNRNF